MHVYFRISKSVFIKYSLLKYNSSTIISQVISTSSAFISGVKVDLSGSTFNVFDLLTEGDSVVVIAKIVMLVVIAATLLV